QSNDGAIGIDGVEKLRRLAAEQGGDQVVAVQRRNRQDVEDGKHDIQVERNRQDRRQNGERRLTQGQLNKAGGIGADDARAGGGHQELERNRDADRDQEV